MKITPERKKMVQSLDEVRAYIISSAACAVLAIVSFLVFVATIDRLYICFVISGIIGLVYAFKSVREMRTIQNRITDITNNFIEVDEESILCLQTAGDTYETCCIFFNEIKSLTEITENGKCGFYIQIIEDADERSSVIQANNVITEEAIFEMRGGLYDTEKFISIYDYVVERLPETAVVEKRAVKKNWFPKTKSQKKRFFITPWVLSAIFLVLQFVALYFIPDDYLSLIQIF